MVLLPIGVPGAQASGQGPATGVADGIGRPRRYTTDRSGMDWRRASRREDLPFVADLRLVLTVPTVRRSTTPAGPEKTAAKRAGSWSATRARHMRYAGALPVAPPLDPACRAPPNRVVLARRHPPPRGVPSVRRCRAGARATRSAGARAGGTASQAQLRRAGAAGGVGAGSGRRPGVGDRGAHIARRLSEGKIKREAIRCLERHLVRTICNTMTSTPGDAPLRPSPRQRSNAWPPSCSMSTARCSTRAR